MNVLRCIVFKHSFDLSLCDEPCSRQQYDLDDKAMRAAIAEDNSLTYELAREFNVMKQLDNELRYVCRCFFRIVMVHIHWVLTSDEQRVLNHTPKRYKHWLSPKDAVPQSAMPPTHPHKTMICVGWQLVKCFTMNCFQQVTQLLWTCIFSNCNVCNMHCNTRAQHK